ncbi:MAG TPA: hypothetical protein VHR43_08780 [Gemmatimonadales bacterium]|jgi:hypothetical protein|nr:hypothetical protein [Gemmatimonadales bacterium]
MTPTSPGRLSGLALAGALLVTFVLPAPAAAQYRLPALVSTAKADSLHDAAAALAAAHRWRDAAALHRRSAELRGDDDPLGFRCLTEAAALAYATGDRSRARSDMATAAEHALARGELKAAALAYLDAAWIAQEQANRRQVWELGHRAELLADSPLLASPDRAAILRRIDRAPEAMKLAMRQQP